MFNPQHELRYLAPENMVDCAEKAQHLRRCSTHNIRQLRVACTIVWQPWAIKSATPTALKHLFYNTIKDIMRINKRQIVPIFQWIYLPF